MGEKPIIHQFSLWNINVLKLHPYQTFFRACYTSAPCSTRILYLWGTLPQEPTGEYYQKFCICCRKKQISHPQKSSHGSCTLQRICHCMLRNIQTLERLMRKFTKERLEIQILQNATRIVSWHWSMAWRIDWIQATLLSLFTRRKPTPITPYTGINSYISFMEMRKVPTPNRGLVPPIFFLFKNY